MRTYEEILKDIAFSAQRTFYHGYQSHENAIIESATKIYLAELRIENEKQKRDGEEE